MKTNEEGRTARGRLVLAGLIGSAALAIFAVALVSRKEAVEEGKISPFKPDATGYVKAPSARPDPVPWRPIAPPTREANAEQVDVAMDHSNMRSFVRTLMEAAATENPALQKTMIAAIGRYGTGARPLIQEELNRAQSPEIRKALEEALASAR